VGVGYEEMAGLVNVRAALTPPVTGEMVEAWEDSSQIIERPAGAFLAAYELAGVRHIGDLEAQGCASDDEVALEAELLAVRDLLDNPIALLRRANRLLRATG
jgi:hypothetical protein